MLNLVSLVLMYVRITEYMLVEEFLVCPDSVVFLSVHHFYAYAIAVPSVCLSACQMGGSYKNGWS